MIHAVCLWESQIPSVEDHYLSGHLGTVCFHLLNDVINGNLLWKSWARWVPKIPEITGIEKAIPHFLHSEVNGLRPLCGLFHFPMSPQRKFSALCFSIPCKQINTHLLSSELMYKLEAGKLQWKQVREFPGHMKKKTKTKKPLHSFMRTK